LLLDVSVAPNAPKPVAGLRKPEVGAAGFKAPKAPVEGVGGDGAGGESGAGAAIGDEETGDVVEVNGDVEIGFEASGAARVTVLLSAIFAAWPKDKPPKAFVVPPPPPNPPERKEVGLGPCA
jgi:hypothetical protein